MLVGVGVGVGGTSKRHSIPDKQAGDWSTNLWNKEL